MLAVCVTEGLDLSQVPLRPRGRPCRFFGDLMAQIQEGQNSRDSSTTDVETVINGHLAEAQMLMNNESNAAVTAAAMAAASMKKKEEGGQAVRPAEEVVTVIPRAPEETAAEEEAAAAAAAAMTGVQPSPDERALSLSVELAAVNQAILSLTGQQPLGAGAVTSAGVATTTSVAPAPAPAPALAAPATTSTST